MTPLAEAARLAAALGPLRLARAARAGAPGHHARARAGEGTEFWQFRPVFPGEPAARIDWRRSARGEQLWARERERADPARLLLWLDPADSMDFASAPGLPTKRDRAATLLLALGLAAMAGGERVGIPGQPATPSGEAIAAALLRASPSPPQSQPGDVLVAASDFLALDASAAARGAGGVLLHLLDPAERDFALTGDCLVEAAPGGAALRLAPAETARPAYTDALAAHQARIAAAAACPGWSLLTHATDRSAAAALAALARALTTTVA